MVLPASGIIIVLLMSFALPSRYLYNQFATILRIYTGVALLAPVPLAAASLSFFFFGVRGLRKEPGTRGMAMAVAGLSLSAASLILFVTIITLIPQV
jgi:hypothetical protein